MSFRIAYAEREPLPSKATKPVKRKSYLAWLHELPCIVTGELDVQAAHLSERALSFGHLGRGKARKASDRWALPLSPSEHARQHKIGEEAYWKAAGINPHIAALVLWGLWSDLGDDATEYALIFIKSLRRRP